MKECIERVPEIWGFFFFFKLIVHNQRQLLSDIVSERDLPELCFSSYSIRYGQSAGASQYGPVSMDGVLPSASLACQQ